VNPLALLLSLFFHVYTGAGDAFVAALAYFYSTFPHATLMQKVAASMAIASHTVQFKGTQSSYVNFPVIDPTTVPIEYQEL
jgi:sugar/nucleoside kinase (ribokinase family)